MTAGTGSGPAYDIVTGRPIDRLPARELLRVSLYWLGISSIFAGLGFILLARLELEFAVAGDAVGRTLTLLLLPGTVIAIVVQPTVGSISDYTKSRWGRRKPYIFIGTLLDVVFLAGIAFSQELKDRRIHLPRLELLLGRRKGGGRQDLRAIRSAY